MPLDPQAKALFDFLGLTQMAPLETLTPQEARAGFEALAEARRQMTPEPVDQVRDLKIPGPAGEIPIRVYSPKAQSPSPALIYFHGGGWVLGDLESHDHVCRAVANSASCVVLSVDYRLAPEHKFPAAVYDSYAATKWIADHAGELGVDASRIAVGGDSAGGNLAAVVSQIARDRGGPHIIHQLLIYPATDMRMGMPSIDENADGPLLTKAAMHWFVNHYLNSEADRTDPLASPLLAANLRGLPPAFIITAECDPIRDEGEAYGLRLEDARVPVDVQRYDGMPHGFFSFGAALDSGRRAFADATSRLRSAFGLEEVSRSADSAA
ncbi:MAG TPA: alpha/beta hydrolase [Bryobacteraceae bacterium]|jgi:acetyl esterase|nr:alpha/beta hydrolase [Bryobacteraceae bacterium]